jgi:hypothetical protein
MIFLKVILLLIAVSLPIFQIIIWLELMDEFSRKRIDKQRFLKDCIPFRWLVIVPYEFIKLFVKRWKE